MFNYPQTFMFYGLSERALNMPKNQVTKVTVLFYRLNKQFLITIKIVFNSVFYKSLSCRHKFQKFFSVLLLEFFYLLPLIKLLYSSLTLDNLYRCCSNICAKKFQVHQEELHEVRGDLQVMVSSSKVMVQHQIDSFKVIIFKLYQFIRIRQIKQPKVLLSFLLLQENLLCNQKFLPNIQLIQFTLLNFPALQQQ